MSLRPEDAYPTTQQAIINGVLFALCVGAFAFTHWLAMDHSNTKQVFVEDCEAQGGRAMTPQPGRGEWLCIDPEYLKEVKQ